MKIRNRIYLLLLLSLSYSAQCLAERQPVGSAERITFNCGSSTTSIDGSRVDVQGRAEGDVYELCMYYADPPENPGGGLGGTRGKWMAFHMYHQYSYYAMAYEHVLKCKMQDVQSVILTVSYLEEIISKTTQSCGGDIVYPYIDYFMDNTLTTPYWELYSDADPGIRLTGSGYTITNIPSSLKVQEYIRLSIYTDASKQKTIQHLKFKNSTEQMLVQQTESFNKSPLQNTAQSLNITAGDYSKKINNLGCQANGLILDFNTAITQNATAKIIVAGVSKTVPVEYLGSQKLHIPFTNGMREYPATIEVNANGKLYSYQILKNSKLEPFLSVAASERADGHNPCDGVQIRIEHPASVTINLPNSYYNSYDSQQKYYTLKDDVKNITFDALYENCTQTFSFDVKTVSKAGDAPEVVFPDRLDANYCEGGRLAVFVKNNEELTEKGYKVWASYNNGDSVTEITSLYTYTYLQPKPGMIKFYSESNSGCKNEKSYSVQYLEHTQIKIIASDTTICENQSFSFRVKVKGGVPISFKWACNNEIIPNSQNLEVLTIPKGEHGIYSYDLKEISGGCNPVVANTAQVNLLKTPQSIKLNSNPKICNGISDIKALTTDDSLNYIWVANSNIIPSENKDLLSTSFNDGAYDVYAVGYYVEQCKCYSDTIHVDAAKVEPTAARFANQSRIFCQADGMNIVRQLVNTSDSIENMTTCSSKYRFESKNSNLKVDGVNGYIDLEQSEPGEYALSMYVNNSDASNPVFCEIPQDTMIIEVVPLPSPFTIQPADANLSMQGDTIILNSSQDFTMTSSMQDTVIWYRNDTWEHLGETWCDKTTNISNTVYRAKSEHKGCARRSSNQLFVRRES